jgi:ATP-dependent metalloprotease
LTDKRNELELLTKALIEYETLSKDEMEKVLRGEKLEKLQSIPSAPLKLPEALQVPSLNPSARASEPPSTAAK